MHSFPILFNDGYSVLDFVPNGLLYIYWFSCGLPSPPIRLLLILSFACHSIVLRHFAFHSWFLLVPGVPSQTCPGMCRDRDSSSQPTPLPELTEPHQSLDSLGLFVCLFVFQLREICVLHDYCVFDFFFHLHVGSLDRLLQFCSFAPFISYLCAFVLRDFSCFIFQATNLSLESDYPSSPSMSSAMIYFKF